MNPQQIANEAAALFLVQEIMPLIWARLPEAHVTIAGSSPPASVLALKHDARVEVTGFLPDLRPVIAQAAVAACPLRAGARPSRLCLPLFRLPRLWL